MERGNSSKMFKSLLADEMPAKHVSELNADKKLDVGTTHVRFANGGDAFPSDYDEDYDELIDEILYGGPAKEKFEVLAMLVGADCGEPEDVLTKAINVLAELEKEKARVLMEMVKLPEPKK